MLAALLLLAAGSAPIGTVDAFLAKARAEASLDRVSTVRTMGRNADISRRITEQVLAGEKTMTVARLAEFAERGWKVPKAGDVVLVVDFDGQPAFLYRVIAAETVPFAAISAMHVVGESPGLRDVESWRAAHRKAWQAALDGLTPAEADALPVVWQQIAPIYPVAR
ncbi:ASCH domain-containing protein [Sphingomonas flavalba]|uniref:ASCH domain-containing protein n=1 Tax=Sphingomonas flavalba TaxID=2559804 RepID=UPI00109D9DBC|nr:ASCH domain-containing protein [Sphingomonas flavalba]